LGLFPFILFEASLRLAGGGRPSEAQTPAIGFTAVHPLFELNEAGDRYEIARSRRPYFAPDGFAAQKREREFRIFCLGDSTVQGNPYSVPTSFTTWLELSLQAAEPERPWEVVNCGGISYASYRLVPILEETLRYEPDLFIIYTGHNEFLEARTYGHPERSWNRSRSAAWLSHWRTFNLLRSAVVGPRETLRQPDIVLAAEVDALLDYRGGIRDYHRDDGWRRGAVESYADNLRRMIFLARNAGVPVLLLKPVSNLRDCPPFKVEPDAALTDKQRATFEERWSAARATTNVDRRIELLEQALAIDGRRADVRFLLAHAYLSHYREDEAREQFLRSKDEDVCPLRMIEPLYAALQAVAEETRTPLLDIRGAFEQRSQFGVPGDSLLVDHVHPSISGYQLMAEEIIHHLLREGVVQASGAWQNRRDELYLKHLGTLDAVYYAKGKQHLEGLTRWTQGRANKLRDGTRLPPGLDDEE